MKKNRQFNLQEVLSKEFGFTPIDIDRYQELFLNFKTSEELKNTVVYVDSKPSLFKTLSHKRNTVLKKCRELSNKLNVNTHNTQSIGNIIAKSFKKNK